MEERKIENEPQIDKKTIRIVICVLAVFLLGMMFVVNSSFKLKADQIHDQLLGRYFSYYDSYENYIGNQRFDYVDREAYNFNDDGTAWYNDEYSLTVNPGNKKEVDSDNTDHYDSFEVSVSIFGAYVEVGYHKLEVVFNTKGEIDHLYYKALDRKYD